jgi:uncharacterized protein
MYVARRLKINEILQNRSVLLLGPRRTGKSALVVHEVKPDRLYNLLEADTYQALARRPSLIREALQPNDRVIAIDEIQKLPMLMDEVHSLIEGHGVRFVLTGSSARKLMRSHTQLMGGRARSLRLHPFSVAELGTVPLLNMLTFGMMPFAALQPSPWEDLRSYVGDYVREEVAAEGLVRKIDQFARFLEVAAITHTQELNFEGIARDAQMPGRTVRDYFDILVDTLFGDMLVPYRKSRTRKATTHGKFYFFDIGVPHVLLKTKELVAGTSANGTALEHLIYRELATYRDSCAPDMELSFYRDTSKRQIDFLVNDDIGVEVKSSTGVDPHDYRHLLAVGDELPLRRRIVVCLERHRRRVGPIEILPVATFLEELWSGELLL